MLKERCCPESILVPERKEINVASGCDADDPITRQCVDPAYRAALRIGEEQSTVIGQGDTARLGKFRTGRRAICGTFSRTTRVGSDDARDEIEHPDLMRPCHRNEQLFIAKFESPWRVEVSGQCRSRLRRPALCRSRRLSRQLPW